MRLTKAEFSGFGRLAEAQINLDHKVVAIVGPNEAGKTTLLRALAYIDNGESLTVAQRSRGLPEDIADNHVVVRVQYRLDEDDQAAVKEFDLNEKPTELWLSRTAGPGQSVRRVVPAPRKNLATLSSALNHLKSKTTTATLAALEPAKPAEGEVSDAPDERRTSFASRLKDAVALVDTTDAASVVQQAIDLEPAIWISQFDEHGLGGEIRVALERIQEWIAQPDPTDEVATALYKRSPDILLFSDEDRLLAPSYELNEQSVTTPPAALRNITTMAELPLSELWKTINNGDEGARETLIEQANQTLQEKFTQVWNQSNICAHLKINNTSLEIRIKQDGQTITQFHERSAGVQMFVALVAFLTVTGRSVPPVLLIDEAENHLHIDAQADLVTEFMTQNRAAKIIYTTHSPACLPHDLGTNIRAVTPSRENSLYSTVEGSFWTNGFGYSPLMLAMGAGAAAFSAARKVVLTEGATEMILLPSLIKRAIGTHDLDYQVAPGISEAPVSMYPELDLEGARVAFLVDGDNGGRELHDALVKAGVSEERIITLGALTLENLLDVDSYKRAITELINESGAHAITDEDFPDLGANPTVLWPNVIKAWAKERGYSLPGKRVIASRLVEEGLAIPSEAGIPILKSAHEALIKVLDVTSSGAGSAPSAVKRLASDQTLS